ncbi:MAG: bacteriohemerythrin [Betaproteobacteria bacterium]|uniref:Bacteriohemerythrin n=1 Tax=Candidatus Proximibacter danicus TaxID=2954365 RepID=A0A9D7K1C8_9PROT|nr:bacteriohemerythrin [Candidatus Proximibacter danicus]
MLSTIRWSSQLATGITEVDNQHGQLIHMLNALARQREQGADMQQVRILLYELRRYASFHFQAEEHLMAQWPVNENNRSAHLRAHASFVEYLCKAEEMLEASSADALDHLLAFLVKWLVHHITGVDARMARELAALGMPLVPVVADADAGNGDGSNEQSSIHDALINTVSELYDSISVRTLELLDSNQRLLEQMQERERAETTLRSSEERYRAMTDNGQALIWMAGADGEANYFNRPWLVFTGRRMNAELGRAWLNGVHPEDLPRCQEAFRKALEQRQKFSIVWRLRRHDGVYRWMVCEGAPRYGNDGEFCGYVGHCLDITEHRAAEEHQQIAAQVFETMAEAVMVTNARGIIQRVNRSFTAITGYEEEEVVGRSSRFLTSYRHDEAFHEEIWQQLEATGAWSGEEWIRLKNGDVRPMRQSASVLRTAQGAVTHYVAVLSDISEMRHAQALAEQLSWRDTLTGLGNRSYFLKQLAQETNRARHEGRMAAVLLVDIDRFRQLNEARGLGVGDIVLVTVSSLLVEMLHTDDTVARLQADEFAILLPRLSGSREEVAQAALMVAERLREKLLGGIAVNGEALHPDCSIGVAVFPDSTQECAEDILRQAELGEQQAKAEGGGRVRFFESDMGNAVRERFELEKDLRRGVDAGELRLYLQSQVDVGGLPVGAEALVRWEHPVRGLVSPMCFIPIAEATHLIVAVDRWMLSEVCRLLARMDADGKALRIAVNISPRHFQREDFVGVVMEILTATGADPTHLVFEVTEGLLIGDVDDVIAKMNTLQTIGIRFSLDDFGTGYSSLSYLKRLPIHELKIDKSFIRDLTVDTNDAALVDSILAVASHMGLQVVAEGVETQSQADFLNARKQVIHQGYLYGRPQEVHAWLMGRNAVVEPG